MGYKTVAEIFNDVFNSSDHALNTVYKTDGEILNLVFDESADGPALRVNLAGYIPAKDIIDGEVDTFAELPAATEHSGEIYIVSTTTGIPLINRKQAGMYRSDGLSWSLLDVDLQADKVYYSGSVPAGNVQDALETLNALMNAHSSSTANPHSVTAAQVDAYTISQINDLLASKLGTTGKAADADKLDGFDSIYFAPASHNHDSAYLGIAGKAADADKLDGFDSSDFARFAQVTGAVGNINSPLLHLPLKKNLLTQQGQSVCTFTRASVATYTDRYGVLKSVAADTPRFTADGLLIEGASTNLLTYSEQFDNATWAKTRATITANTSATTDLYGTNLADKIVENSSASTSHYINQSCSFTAGSTYTISVFAKASERSEIALQFPAAAFGSILSCIFNLASGTCDSTGTITALANGWYRCTFTATATITASGSPTIILRSDNSYLYTGDGTSGLYIFGAQLEALPFATSYIPTTTTSATRAAGYNQVAQAENVPLYASNFGIVADLILSIIPSADAYFLGDGDTATGFNLRINSTGTIGVVHAGNAYASTAVLVAGTKYRIAIVKSSGSLYIYVNGVLDSSHTLSGTPVNLTNIFIGSYSGSVNTFFGSISNLRIYDRALTAEEVRLA